MENLGPLSPKPIVDNGHTVFERNCCEMFVDFAEMFLIIISSIALGALIWFLVKKDPEPVLGIYSQPGIKDRHVILYCIL